MKTYIKEFQVREGSTDNMWYKIEVFDGGEVVEVFLEPTMRAAEFAFRMAGYKKEEGK